MKIQGSVTNWVVVFWVQKVTTTSHGKFIQYVTTVPIDELVLISRHNNSDSMASIPYTVISNEKVKS